MTDKPSMVTDVTVINRINIGSDHRMVMGSITLNTRAERRKLLNKNTRTRVDTQMIGTKKNTFQLELKNRFTALEEHDDMDSLNKNMTETIQQSAMSIAKQTKKQKKKKMSSPTRALMKKLREMIENNTPRDHIEYVEICKTIKKKAREDTRKHNLDEIRETIEESKSLKKIRRTHNLMTPCRQVLISRSIVGMPRYHFAGQILTAKTYCICFLFPFLVQLNSNCLNLQKV